MMMMMILNNITIFDTIRYIVTAIEVINNDGEMINMTTLVAIRHRLFDFFFRTKASQLSLCLRIGVRIEGSCTNST